MKQKLILAILLSTLVILSNNSFAIEEDKGGKLSTLEVIQHTLNACSSCLHYKIVGVCFWLVCDAGICSVETTPKVDHYLPDVVVSVFQKQNTNPWDYANTVIDTVAYQAGNMQVKSMMGVDIGHGNEETSADKNSDTHFKEVDAIGNPAISILNKFRSFLIPSVATPFVPYYVSLADSYAWRSPIIESLMYPHRLIPGVSIVGSLANNWGNVYPRTGFLLQTNDAKASAVISQRAADIATHTTQPHAYKSLSTICGEDCKVFETKENDENTQWQMIYPITEKTCKVFGENDLTNATPWGTEATQKGNGNYTWVLWRHYRGCIQGEGKYLGSVEW